MVRGRGGKFYEFCGFMGEKFLNVVGRNGILRDGEWCECVRDEREDLDARPCDRETGWQTTRQLIALVVRDVEGSRGRSEWYICSSAIATTVPVHACPTVES